MYLENFVSDKDAILVAAMAHPAMAQKRKPTIETALKCVVSSLEMAVSKGVQEYYLPLIRDTVDMYEIENGEYDTLDPEAKGDWSSGMDDKIEALFEPLTQSLSADWLARYTIDTHMEAENACETLAKSLGREVFKQLSYGKEPGAVLSNAGILRSDVDIYYSQHMQPKQENTAMAETLQTEMQGVIGAIFAQVGADFDIMNVMDEVDNITDDDEILAGGSAQRLGMDEAELLTVQMYVVEVGKAKAGEDILSWLQNYTPGKPPQQTAPPAPPAPAAAGVPAPPAPAQAPGATAGAGFDGKRVLSLLKEHSSAKDTDMAAALGVSRGTYLNWIAGKTVFAPDNGQRETVRSAVLSHMNAMYEALCLVDNVPLDRVYD